MFAAENAVDGQQHQEECTDSRQRRARRVEHIGERIGHRLAHDQLDGEDESGCDKKGEQCAAGGRKRLGVPCGEAGSIDIDARTSRDSGIDTSQHVLQFHKCVV
ncbi:hypothetical protein D9M70_549230 [compost metagenome]